jgi:hypothetical protein
MENRLERFFLSSTKSPGIDLFSTPTKRNQSNNVLTLFGLKNPAFTIVIPLVCPATICSYLYNSGNVGRLIFNGARNPSPYSKYLILNI